MGSEWEVPTHGFQQPLILNYLLPHEHTTPGQPRETGGAVVSVGQACASAKRASWGTRNHSFQNLNNFENHTVPSLL